MDRCRTCRYFEFGKCYKGLPIEIDSKLTYQIGEGDLAEKIERVLEENNLNLDEETLLNVIDDIERVVSNLSEDYELIVNEDFKCKYYE